MKVNINRGLNRRAYINEELHVLWNSDFQCHIHKDSPIIPSLSRINRIPRNDNYFFKIYFIIDLRLRLGLPRDLFPMALPLKMSKALVPSSVLTTCPDNINLLDIITLLY